MIVPSPDNRLFKVIRGLVYLWIAALVLALDPRTEDPAAPIKMLASGLALVCAMVLWAFALRTGRAPYRRMNPVLWYQFYFFFVLGFLALISDTPDRSRLALSPWGVFALMGFVVYQTFPYPRHLRNLFRVLVSCVALSSAYGLMQYFGWDPFPWAERNVEEYRALPATYGNPNLAGHVLVVALILCVGLLADTWQRRQGPAKLLIYLAPGGLMATHLGLTHMRGGLVALGVALLYVVVYRVARSTSRTRRHSSALALLACAATMGLALVALLVFAPYLNLDSSVQLRLNGYVGAATLFLAHPFAGIGFGNYAYQAIPEWSRFESLWYALEGKRNFHVHNEWLEMAAECGIPGLAGLIGLFVFSIILFFNNPWLPAERHRALLMVLPAAIVAIGADACFGFNLHAPVSTGLFFLLLAQGPARPHYSPPVRARVRKGALVMVVLALGTAWPMWRDYDHERQFQRVQGAIAWERSQRDAGTAPHTPPPGAALLEKLTRDWPGDYRGWMLRGDFALEQRETTLAVEAFGEALRIHPHLPRLHVQLARAEIRLAQEQHPDQAEAHLKNAEHHARIARDRCPDLAEAWALLGWCDYVRTTIGAPDAMRRTAIEAFERSRSLGPSADGGIDAALGELYALDNAWADAAQAYERCMRRTPDAPAPWLQWNKAATAAGGDALRAHRQALLFDLGRASKGDLVLPPELVEWMAGQITEFPRSPEMALVTDHALRDALEKLPALTGVWSAWLGLAEKESRATRLVERLASMNEVERGAVSPVIQFLEHALTTPRAETISTAAHALASTLATAPGAEDFTRKALYAPLVALLESTMTDNGQAEATPMTAHIDLGAALFEVGELSESDAALSAAETVLPEDGIARAWYYHSRTLASLGQHDAALALAKQAVDADGGPVEYRWQFARCLVLSGRRDAAKFIYDGLLAGMVPDHPYRARLTKELRSLSNAGTTP